MRGVDLGLFFDAKLLEDRHQRVAEAAKSVLGLPDIDDAKAIRALPRSVDKQSFDGPVGDSRRLLPPVSLRTVSSYRSCVRVGP